MTTLQSAQTFEELLGPDVEAAPYNYPLLFKGDGVFARRRAKKRFKLLKGIDAKLRPILLANEKVYFLTPGTAVNLSEQFFVGWLAYYLNMHALVFTSNRVLLMRVDGARRPRDLVSQIPYGTISTVKSTWNGLCRVKLISKQTYDFQHVPSADRKFLSKFLSGVVQGSTAPFQSGLGIEHLCPHCFAFVPGHPLVCPNCYGSFKSAGKAGLLSLAFPGVGDWYLGHRGFALLEMGSALVMWLALIILPVAAPGIMNYGPLNKGYWLFAALAVLTAHGVAGMMTRHFARKGHYPAAKPLVSISRPPQPAPTIDMPKPPAPTTVKKTLSLRRDPPPTDSAGVLR
jgi:hypothetical protein